ncbi:MAG: fatty acid desaturase [Acidimicrobiales bacterium]
MAGRDYSLTGPEAARARERGLAEAEAWFRPVIDPERLRALSRRSNGRAAADTLLWLGLIAGTGLWAWSARGSWWAVPAFALYGVLYSGMADARWHEMGHGTAFRTRWLNDALYHLACFMIIRGPTLWRWSHARHHSDTIIVGRDAEIAVPRPTTRRQIVVMFLGVPGTIQMIRRTVRHARGRLEPDVLSFVPPGETGRVVREAQVFVALWAAVVVAAVATRSPVPLLYVGLPSFYGIWVMVFFGLTQHAGLQEDVLDHRLNTRTVLMNPFFRFLYLNMNYHVEHHLFPTVPYHALPALHREVAGQLAPPLPNTRAAYRELLAATARQAVDPRWEIPNRRVPELAGAGRSAIDTGTRLWHRGPGTAPGPEPATADAAGLDLGPADTVAEGGLRRVDIGDATFVVARVGPSEYRVADGFCTHGRAHLADGVLVGCEVECPRHNGRFDLRTGRATRRPATDPVALHPVTVVGGHLRLTDRSG